MVIKDFGFCLLISRKPVQGTIKQLTTAPREYLSCQPCLYQVYSLSIRTSSANNQSHP